MKRTPLKRSKKKLNKHGKSKLAKLKKKAWDTFALWVKKRDNWTCITCGKRFLGKEMHAGHLWHGDWMDFIEENINAQCSSCNYAKNRNSREISAIYVLEADRKYGPGTADRLKALWIKRYAGLREKDYEKIIEKYSNPPLN